MADDKIEIEILLDDRTIKQSFDVVEKEGQKSARTIGKSFGNIEDTAVRSTGKISTAFIGLAKTIKANLLAIGAALAAALSAKLIFGSIQAFRDLEQALVGVQKTTDLSGGELEKIRTEIQALSTEIPVATNELLGLAQQAGQFGVTGTQDLVVFTETVARLSAAIDGIDASSAAEGLVRILNISNENISSIETLASVVVNLGNNLAATEGDIINASLEISRATAGFGLASNEVATLAGALTALGVQAESGGTSIGKTFRTIDKAVIEGGKNLQNFARVAGESVTGFKNLFQQDALGAFNLFIQGLNRIERTGGNVSKTLLDLGLNNERVLKTLVPLATGYNQYQKALSLTNTELKDANSLQEESQRAFGTLDAGIKKLTQAFDNLLGNLGDLISETLGLPKLIEFLKEATVGVSNFLNSLRTTELEALDAQIESVTKKLELARANVANSPFSGLLAVRAGDQEAVNQLQTQLDSLIAKRQTLIQQSEKIKQENLTAASDLTNISGAITSAVDVSTNAFQLSFQVVGGLFNNFKNTLGEAAVFTKQVSEDIAKSLASTFARGVTSAIQSTINALVAGQNAFKAFASSVFNLIADLLIQLGESIIAIGIAKQAIEFLPGGAAIAAGFGLIALGAALKALAGSNSFLGGGAGQASGGVPATQPVAGVEDSPVFEDDDFEEQRGQIVVNVDGTVLDPKSVGLQIAEILKDVNDSNDLVTVNV